MIKFRSIHRSPCRYMHLPSRTLSRSNHVAAMGGVGHQSDPTAPSPLCLIIDATNIASRASVDSKNSNKTVSTAICFEKWIQYLIFVAITTATATTATAPLGHLIAVFDSPDARPQKQGAEQYLLRRRRRRHQQQNNNSKNNNKFPPSKKSNPNRLYPLIKVIQSVFGGIAIVSEQGYEADECIGAVVGTLQQVQGQPRPMIVIASGDKDMQHFLETNVMWMDVVAAAAPAGNSKVAALLHDASSFTSRYGFPPSAYADYLALVGKKEASIGGVGIGASSAKKLLKRFQSLEAAVEAVHVKKQGKGYSSSIVGALTPGTEQYENILIRNKEIFRVERDPEMVLTEKQRSEIVRYYDTHAVGIRTGVQLPRREEEWKYHPYHAIRWHCIGETVQYLKSSIEVRGALWGVEAETDIPVDILVKSASGTLIGVMVCGPCDLKVGVGSSTTSNCNDTMVTALRSRLSEHGGDGDGTTATSRIFDPFGLRQRLTPSMKSHTQKVLKEHSELHCVMLVNL